MTDLGQFDIFIVKIFLAVFIMSYTKMILILTQRVKSFLAGHDYFDLIVLTQGNNFLEKLLVIVLV